MKFFNLSLHISIVADIKNIFEKLNHQVDNWSISNHSHLMGWKRKDDCVINQFNFQNLDQKMCDDFYEKYKKELSQYDGFICDHTPAFSLLYEKFNKPIIVMASTRYEHPFSSDITKWMWLNRYLRSGIENGKIIPIANNKYDAEYFKTFVGKECEVIPSLCAYTKAKWTGKEEKYIYSSKINLQLPNSSHMLVKEDELSSGYKWQALADYRGIVHIPYNGSVMSISEQYTSNIPLIFPSLDFLMDLMKSRAMSEVSYNQIFGLPSRSIIPVLNDPNNFKDRENMKHWFSLSDFYDSKNMPFITYFNSFEDLENRLETIDAEDISGKMKKHNRKRKKEIIQKWKDVLEKI